MTKPFIPIRTHDVVIYKQRRHIVVNVQVSGTKGLLLQLAPIGDELVTVSNGDIQLASPVEQARREGRHDEVQRLRAANVAQEAWALGVAKAAHPTIEPPRKPFSLTDVKQRIKTQIARHANGGILTQAVLDDIVRRVVAAQAYVVTCTKRKPTKSASVPGWEQIASEAVRIGNMYNRNLR